MICNVENENKNINKNWENSNKWNKYKKPVCKLAM